MKAPLIMLFSYFNRIACFSFTLIFSLSLCANPLVWNAPARNNHFVGRETQLQQIQDIFLTSQDRMVVLSAFSGLGKSQIAKQYTYQHVSNYDLIWWFHGNQYLEPQFQTLAAFVDRKLNLGLSEKIDTIEMDRLAKTIFDEIHSRNLTCLLVFDDFKSLENLSPYIPTRGKFHILITTQNANFSPHILPIDAFTREESQELLRIAFPESDLEVLDLLASHLKDNPSSLALAAEYIRQYPGMKIQDYVKKHKNTEIRMGQRQAPGDATDAYKSDLRTATQLSLESLKNISPKTYSFLGFLGVILRSCVWRKR